MFGKDGLSEYLCMYIRAVVSSGSSIKILYPRESYNSREDPEGPIRTVGQSTTNVVVDALVSFCCHILMMLLFQLCVVDDVIPTLCY
jgi:hypothetical protein